MKRWRKRLTLFSLLAAGCLIWNLSGVGVKAEETVPQVNLTITDGNDVSLDQVDNVSLKADITVENYNNLSVSDFDTATIWTAGNDTSKNYQKGNYKCITPGKIIVTIKGGQKSSVLNGATAYISTINDKINFTTTSGNLYTPDKTEAKYFANYSPNKKFTVIKSGAMTGLVQLLTYNNKTYVVNFPVEVKCSDYLDPVDDSWKNNTLATVKGSYVNSYIDSVNLSDNTVTITASQYDKTGVAIADVFLPHLAYAASMVGQDVEPVTIEGEEKQAYNVKKFLSQIKDGYSFTIKNAEGKEKTYKVIVDSPWKLSMGATTYDFEPAITIDDVPQQEQTINNVAENRKIKVVFNKLPAKKKLRGIKAEHLIRNSDGSTSDDAEYELSYSISGNSVEFVMPRSDVQISEVLLDDDFSTEPRQITVTPVVENGEETDFAVIEKKVDGAEKSTATENQTVTLTDKGMYPTYRSFCGYRFDHWESNSINIQEADRTESILTFFMPDQNVDVKAVYKRTGVSITAGISNAIVGNISFGNTRVGAITSTSKNVSQVTELCRAGETYNINLSGANFATNRFLGWIDETGAAIVKENTKGIHWVDTRDADTGVAYYYPEITVTDQTQEMTFIASFEAKTACALTFTSNDESKGTVSASVNGTSITSGSNTIYDEDVVTLKAEKKTGYKFAGWEVTSPADVSVNFADAAAEETTFTVPKITSGALTIQGVFEVDPKYLNPDCELTKVELLKQDGTLVKQANRSGITFTIRLSAEDMTAEEARKIASGGYLLRLTYPETATAAMEGGMKDGDSGAALWRTGISNSIGMGGSGTFIITAQRSEFKNTYTIAMEYDDRPVLKAGTVKRISDTEASVGFRSSSAGTYYWAVVDAGEAKPDIPTNGAGTTFKYADRENTIKLTSLTAGAKDLYIVVKNDDDSTNVKISDVLKISIPAFGGAETTYKVNVTGNLPGGKLTVDKKEAKAGETVTVTVTPDSGKKMTTNSLIYSQSSAPYEVVHIDEKTKQFIMPAYELSVSCRFEDENSSTTPDATTTGKIGAFVVNGVSGTVDNTTGLITVTLPNGTDLTSLAPVITISGAKSISPASGATVDLSSPVTYTLTLEDGTTKTYTVRAYVEGPSKSDQLWNDMLNNVDGSPDHSGSKTWWKKAKDLKKHNDYPEYW